MQIEYINQKHRFFQDVKNLGSKNSSTLGFMPEGGFVDYAQKEWIIIAHNDSELIGYLMFRIANRSTRISIVHLCVKEEFRGLNIAIKLLDALRKKYQTTVSGIFLLCRADYKNATALWEKYGFAYKGNKRSKSIEENYLNQWWYDFNNPDLFSNLQETSTKIKALLDTNIIIKLRDKQIDQTLPQDPRALLADWLIEEVDYLYAPELLDEIARDKNKEREEKTRCFLSNFEAIRVDINDCKKIADELKSIIIGNTDNDKSDRMQLATTIISKTPYFITFDNVILDNRAVLCEQYDIQIFTPQELIIEIDQLLNKEEYLPSKLKGVTFHSIQKVLNAELNNYIDLFLAKSQSEKKSNFKEIVYKEVEQIKSSQIQVIKQEDSAVAFFSYKIENSALIIPFIRLLDIELNQTLFMQIISDFINIAINEKLYQINIEEKFLSENQNLTLRKLGFESQLSIWTKFLYNRIIDSTQLSEINSTVDNSAIEKIKEQHTDGIKNILLKFEHKFFPLKFSDLDIPCYVIPIKPYWAGQLFDFNISDGEIFGAQPYKLWNIENVYYRDTRPITESAPARILWYASSDKKTNRSQSIIAASYLDKVMTDKPKLLFQRNKHYGIYEWKNIYELCKENIEKNIRALRFSHTEVFDNPVALSLIREIFIANGKKENTFASPVQIDKNIFIQIYQKGKGNGSYK